MSIDMYIDNNIQMNICEYISMYMYLSIDMNKNKNTESYLMCYRANRKYSFCGNLNKSYLFILIFYKKHLGLYTVALKKRKI